jgi:hypothetical protein
MSILADLFKKKIISGQWVAKFFFIIWRVDSISVENLYYIIGIALCDLVQKDLFSLID